MAFHPRVDYQLSQNTGLLGEPVRQSSWEIEVLRIPGLWMVVTTANLPNPTVDQIEVYHGNEKLKIAGQPDFPNITFELRDTVLPNIARLLSAWADVVYNAKTGIIGYASEYKDRGTIQQYDTKGVLIHSWDLYGIWPTNVNYGSLDYASKDPVLISAEFSVDRCVLTL